MADGQAELSPDSEWAGRSRYWIAQSGEARPKRGRRERESSPLILTGHGLSIRVDKSCLLIRDGNTHYPAERSEWRFFRGALANPPRIIAVDGSGNVSLDALDWMAEQGIALIRIYYDGSQAMVMSASGFSANPEKVRWQLETRDSPKRKLAFAIETTGKKLKAALETLESYLPESEKQISAIQKTESALSQSRKAKSLSALLGIEGATAYAYWMAWRGLTLNWKIQTRYPTPEEWKSFQSRASLLSAKGDLANRRATDPINAMLNYAYAVLMTQMRIQAISGGYDPTIGILHDKRAKREKRTPTFALDLMEPLRPVVDRAVLKLVREETFSGADFVLQSDGVCRLNPELARRVSLEAAGAIAIANSVDELLVEVRT